VDLERSCNSLKILICLEPQRSHALFDTAQNLRKAPRRKEQPGAGEGPERDGERVFHHRGRGGRRGGVQPWSRDLMIQDLALGLQPRDRGRVVESLIE